MGGVELILERATTGNRWGSWRSKDQEMGGDEFIVAQEVGGDEFTCGSGGGWG
jgi:hypothetical protein